MGPWLGWGPYQVVDWISRHGGQGVRHGYTVVRGDVQLQVTGSRALAGERTSMMDGALLVQEICGDLRHGTASSPPALGRLD